MEHPNPQYTPEDQHLPNGDQEVQLRRIDGKYIVDEIGSVLSFKKGIFYTVREMLLRPGATVRGFISADRKRLVKPALFVIFCSFVYTILQRLLDFEDGYISYSSDSQQSTALMIVDWIQGNYGYANLVMSIFVAFWAKVFFRKSGYNFFELLILIFYVFGAVMLISAVFGIIEALTAYSLMTIGGVLSFIYVAWAIGQFFGGRFASYMKALLVYLIGLLSVAVVGILIGVGVDMVV